MNRKKEFKIKTFYFKNIENLADSILEQYEKNEEESEDFIGVSVIAHYDIIVNLINWLVENTTFKIRNIQIEEPDIDNYVDEWILNIDTEGELWCQQAVIPPNQLNNGGYVYCEEDAIFVHNDVNSKFVIRNKEQNLITFEIGENFDKDDKDYECDCYDCCDCRFDKSDDEYKTKVALSFSSNLNKSVKNFKDWLHITRELIEQLRLLDEMETYI